MLMIIGAEPTNIAFFIQLKLPVTFCHIRTQNNCIDQKLTIARAHNVRFYSPTKAPPPPLHPPKPSIILRPFAPKFAITQINHSCSSDSSTEIYLNNTDIKGRLLRQQALVLFSFDVFPTKWDTCMAIMINYHAVFFICSHLCKSGFSGQ